MSIVERGFDVRDHEIIQRVYQAAWARLAASKPVSTPEEESLRQKFLRKRLFAIAKRGTIDFDKLYAEVVAIYEVPFVNRKIVSPLVNLPSFIREKF